MTQAQNTTQPEPAEAMQQIIKSDFEKLLDRDFTPTEVAVDLIVESREFELDWRMSAQLAKSGIAVPQVFRGNQPLCFVICQLARRMRLSAMMLAQNAYEVHGRLGFQAVVLIAAVNASRKFSPIQYEIDGGESPSLPNYRVRAKSIRINKDGTTGELCVGEWITWDMIRKEGWDKPKGTQTSKWMTIPGQMFRYRAATFWGRVYAADLMLGLATADELEDIVGAAQPAPQPTNEQSPRKMTMRGTKGAQAQPAPDTHVSHDEEGGAETDGSASPVETPPAPPSGRPGPKKPAQPTPDRSKLAPVLNDLADQVDAMNADVEPTDAELAAADFMAQTDEEGVRKYLVSLRVSNPKLLNVTKANLGIPPRVSVEEMDGQQLHRVGLAAKTAELSQ